MSPDTLKDIRKRCNLTQPMAAEIIGVTLRTYQRYEWGERAIPIKRAKMLEVASTLPF
jgi:DNA-binding transcriptional regulator YiaG